MVYSFMAGFSLLFVFMCLFCFKTGYNAGQAVAQGKPIEPLIANPIEYIERRAEVKKTQKENDVIAKGISNLFTYDGSPQKGSE